MPVSLIGPEEKELIKRAVSNGTNKIQCYGVARLYIAYPDPKSWHYTGLSGAIVLSFDSVGDCYFFKLVDISGSRGILWDHEIYEGFSYNQDRTFFHSFEIEECMAAFVFVEETDATQFYKKVNYCISKQKKAKRPSKCLQDDQSSRAPVKNSDGDESTWKGVFGQIQRPTEEFEKPSAKEEIPAVAQNDKRVVRAPPPPPSSIPASISTGNTHEEPQRPAVLRKPAPPPPPSRRSQSNLKYTPSIKPDLEPVAKIENSTTRKRVPPAFSGSRVQSAPIKPPPRKTVPIRTSVDLDSQLRSQEPPKLPPLVTSSPNPHHQLPPQLPPVKAGVSAGRTEAAITPGLPPPPPPMPTISTSNTNIQDAKMGMERPILPPPLPPMPSSTALPATLPTAPDSTRNYLMEAIRSSSKSGLKKVETRDSSAPAIKGREADNQQRQVPSSKIPGQPASLADSLAAALSARNKKMSHGDDDSEDDNDWE